MYSVCLATSESTLLNRNAECPNPLQNGLHLDVNTTSTHRGRLRAQEVSLSVISDLITKRSQTHFSNLSLSSGVRLPAHFVLAVVCKCRDVTMNSNKLNPVKLCYYQASSFKLHLGTMVERH